MSSFEGKLTIRSAPFGYRVSMQCQTIPHDLGHALAAAITHYTDVVIKANPGCDREDLIELVLRGIECALENSPDPLRMN